MADVKKIGRHVASQIMQIAPERRSKEQQESLDDFNGSNKLTQEAKERRKEYSSMIASPRPEKPLKPLIYDELFFAFKYEFERLTGKPLNVEQDRLDDYKTLLLYFCKDDRFFESANLSKLSVPSFDKGLLIIGNYGNGKSSCMNAISNALRYYRVKQFKFMTANSVVDRFESCETSFDKNKFWNDLTSKIACFDDVKTERDASNFGKYNIFSDLIQRRYDKGVKTHITGNYHPKFPNDLEKAVMEYGERYDARVYDRLFEMCNIIEFKGKSFRK